MLILLKMGLKYSLRALKFQKFKGGGGISLDHPRWQCFIARLTRIYTFLPNACIILFLLLQNETSDVVQPYNSILTMKRLTLHTDCVVSVHVPVP